MPGKISPTVTALAEWRNCADIDVLRRRAELLADVRSFFQQRGVMEVDCPALGRIDNSDNNIDSFVVSHAVGDSSKPGFLHSSAEFGMKRLLAAGSGDIYQLSHVFRAAEQGSRHNPEFMMLEWYRCGFSITDLIQETAELVSQLAGSLFSHRKIESITYRQAFLRYAQVDVVTASIADLEHACGDIPAPLLGDDRDGWLDWLGSVKVFPELGKDTLCFLTDYPANQAALARLSPASHCDVAALPGEAAVAARFELFINGLEIGNGYHELSDPQEQKQRLEAAGGVVDDRFIAALQHGLPDCAGIAVGIDRLMMLVCEKKSISQVLPFDYDRA